MTPHHACSADATRSGELLGRGGMAEVHLGHDTRLSRPVAIKMLRSDLARDPSFLARFRREAQSAAGLNHPAIVAVYDSGEDHAVEAGGASVPVPYIVMEYVEGQTLRELLNDSVSRSSRRRRPRITEGVLDALAYSHRDGHRAPRHQAGQRHDQPRAATIKVMDFGIARAVADANATMTQTAGGHRHRPVPLAGAGPGPARSTRAPTSTRPAACSSSCSPGARRSPATPRSPIAYQHVGRAAAAPPSASTAGVGRGPRRRRPARAGQGPRGPLPGRRRPSAPTSRPRGSAARSATAALGTAARRRRPSPPTLPQSQPRHVLPDGGAVRRVTERSGATRTPRRLPAVGHDEDGRRARKAARAGRAHHGAHPRRARRLVADGVPCKCAQRPDAGRDAKVAVPTIEVDEGRRGRRRRSRPTSSGARSRPQPSDDGDRG